MATKKWSEVRRSGTPAQEDANRAWVDEQVISLNLRAVRELVGKTQQEVAAIAEMKQGDISDFERREDHLVSKLQRYVSALGGELVITAQFGDKSVRLKGL